jgi:hypothetical protein
VLRSFAGRLRPTPSMVVAMAALVVALGGTSYAVTRLPARSVGTTHLKNAAVTRAKLANNAVDGSKVAFNALTGKDIKEKSLARVPSAASAERATSTGGLDKVTYKVATGTVGPNSGAAATATCDAGQRAVGGGVRMDDVSNTYVIDAYPVPDGTAWSGHVFNTDTTRGHGFAVTAVCLPAAAVG